MDDQITAEATTKVEDNNIATDIIRQEGIERQKRFTAEQNYDYNHKLRLEAKDSRLKLENLEKEKQESEKKKLEEDGNYKELLEKQGTELEGLKSVQSENQKNKEYFNKVLDSELEGLGDSVKEMILSSNNLIVEKIEMAKKIKSEQGLKTNSVGSETIGSGTSTVQDTTIKEEFRALKTPKERQAYMNKLKAQDPQALEKLKKNN